MLGVCTPSPVPTASHNARLVGQKLARPLCSPRRLAPSLPDASHAWIGACVPRPARSFLATLPRGMSGGFSGVDRQNRAALGRAHTASRRRVEKVCCPLVYFDQDPVQLVAEGGRIARQA